MHSLRIPVANFFSRFLLILLLLAYSSKAGVWDDYYQGLYEYQQGLNDYFHSLGNYYLKLNKYKEPAGGTQQTSQPINKQVTLRNTIGSTGGGAQSIVSGDKKKLLDLQNEYRRRVASGQVQGQPASSKIQDLVSFL